MCVEGCVCLNVFQIKQFETKKQIFYIFITCKQHPKNSILTSPPGKKGTKKMGSSLLGPHELLWEDVVLFAGKYGSFFMALQPQILWNAPFIVFIFTGNVYMLYLFTTFAWFDMNVAMAISNVYYSLMAGTSLYCMEAQMLGAFYATAVMHFVFYERRFPGWITFLTCLIGFVAAVIVVEATSAISVLIGLLVGVALGILRILFYVELIDILQDNK